MSLYTFALFNMQSPTNCEDRQLVYKHTPKPACEKEAVTVLRNQAEHTHTHTHADTHTRALHTHARALHTHTHTRTDADTRAHYTHTHTRRHTRAHYTHTHTHTRTDVEDTSNRPEILKQNKKKEKNAY
jgi:hypothetical protein